MFDIVREPDLIEVFCEEQKHNAKVEVQILDKKLHFYLEANGAKPKLVKARWNYTTKEEIGVKKCIYFGY